MVVAGILIACIVLGSVLLYFFMPRLGSEAKNLTNEQLPTLQSLLAILGDSSKNSADVERAIMIFVNDFERLNPNKEQRFLAFTRLVSHANTTSKLILSFEKELKARNPEDARELEIVLKMSLDRRK